MGKTGRRVRRANRHLSLNNSVKSTHFKGQQVSMLEVKDIRQSEAHLLPRKKQVNIAEKRTDTIINAKFGWIATAGGIFRWRILWNAITQTRSAESFVFRGNAVIQRQRRY